MRKRYWCEDELLLEFWFIDYLPIVCGRGWDMAWVLEVVAVWRWRGYSLVEVLKFKEVGMFLEEGNGERRWKTRWWWWWWLFDGKWGEAPFDDGVATQLSLLEDIEKVVIEPWEVCERIRPGQCWLRLGTCVRALGFFQWVGMRGNHLLLMWHSTCQYESPCVLALMCHVHVCV